MHILLITLRSPEAGLFLYPSFLRCLMFKYLFDEVESQAQAPALQEDGRPQIA